MSFDMSQHLSMGKLLKYGLPTIATMVFTSLYGVVDGLFVSQFAGKTAFAAVNIVIPYLVIISSIGYMVGTGGSAVVAYAFGQGKAERANRAFSLLVYVALALGVAFSAMSFVLADHIVVVLGASEELVGYCTLYLRITLVSLPAYILQSAFQTFFATAGKPRYGFRVACAAGLANIVLDALLVGVAGFGIAGAAVATVMGEFIGGFVPFFYFMRKNNSSSLHLGKTSFDIHVIGSAFFNGTSELVTNIAMSVVSVVYNQQLMRLLGQDGVAAYGVIMYVSMIFAAVYYGYSTGTAPLMSYQYGAANRSEMQSLLAKGLTFISLCGVAMVLLAQLFARPLAQMFVGYDASLCTMTEQAFREFSLSFGIMGFSIFGSALFTSLGNGLVSAAISCLRTLVFEVGSVIVLPMLFGVGAIWLSVVVAESASLVMTVSCLIGFRKRYGYFKSR